MALNTRLNVQLDASLTSALDLVSASAPLSLPYRKQLTNGTGVNQADLVWSDKREIAASGNDDIDLAGTLTDPFGATVTYARVKLLLVKAADSNTHNVVIGGHTTAAWHGPFGAAAHTAIVRPGGVLVVAASDATAWPVTEGTADVLRVSNSGAGTPVTYDIVIVGASA